MRTIQAILCTCLGIFYLLNTPVFAQNAGDLNLKLQSSVFLEETTGEGLDMTPYLAFPKIGEYPYFEDKRMKELIFEAEEAEDLQALDSLLGLYIPNFGVENFQKDIELIWRAGQVKEILGDTLGSLMYYELGIKNQRPYNEKVKIHLDSLKEKTHNEWVNLQFYYKILEARRKIDPLIPPKGVMLNMGPKVNSEAPDYAPFMHPSDSILIFTSRRDEEIVIDDIHHTQNEDLFFVQKDWIGGTWSYAEKFSESVNSKFNEGSSCLSRDGKTFFFTRCDADDGLGSCDIYIAHFTGGDWKGIKNLGPNINSTAWDSHPNITPDGKTLFFTSNREGGFGLSDLYVSVLQDDGTWSKARNLGPTINTVEDEVTPFFHKVNNTLYFSSTGHLRNLGGYDIFKARWFNKHWENPKNVGPLVNTPGNEYYFSIDGKGSRLFYAKSKEGDISSQYKLDFDLFSFPLPMEARPDAIVKLRGYLIDSASGHPITGIVLVIDKQTGIEVAPKHINRFGYFEFDLINNKQYEIYIQGDNYLTIHDQVVLDNDTTFSIFANSFEAGKPLVFESFEFADDSYELDGTFKPKLEYLGKFLKRYPMFRMEVKGHTDSDGEAKYNLDLSRKRALQIRNYIVKSAGIKDDRVMAKGFGESKPLVPNDSEENKRLNRRVEFEVWLDPNYEGEMILPAGYEFFFEDEDELMFDPEFMEEEAWEWDNEFHEAEFDTEDYDWDDTDEDLFKEWDDWGIDGMEDDIDDFDDLDDLDDPDLSE